MDALQDMAVVGPNTGTVGLRKKGATNVFWVRANYDQEVEKLVSTASTLGITHIGLVHPNDPLGQSLLAAFNAATAKFNLKPAIIATTPGTTSPEVDPAAREIAKAAPQVVIMGLAGTAPAFVRALRVAGGTSTIYGLSIGASATNINSLGDASRGLGFSIVVPSPFASKYEIVRRYQADMQASGNTEYSLPSLEGYINARVLAEGLRRAGGNPTRESVLAGLESIDSLELGGLRIGYGKTKREGSNFVDVAVVGAGQRLMS
jgi:ABC-type branched-subunit amino acid transport system substrate-binding protein